MLRLAPTSSGTRTRLTLGHGPPLAGWSDIVTDLRVGPDAMLYQMGTSPTTGNSMKSNPSGSGTSTSGGKDDNGDQGRDKMPESNKAVQPTNKPGKM